MFNSFYFEHPIFILFFFLFVGCAIFCKMRLPSFYFPHSSQFSRQIGGHSRILFFLKWFAIVMMVLALMSPVKEMPFAPKPKQGIDIALILDTSGSMDSKGFDPYNLHVTKFDVVKNIVEKFIKQRVNDNIGLVVFGSYSFIAAPLTYDKNILNEIVSRLKVAMAGQYTALYDSLAQGVNLLKNSKAKTKIAILMTDGYNTPQVTRVPLHVALKMANKYHIKIYTIGIGNDYDAALLQEIARSTDAKSFGARNASELRRVYRQIDKLEKSKLKGEHFIYKKQYFFYPLFFGFIALLLYIFLMNKRGHE